MKQWLGCGETHGLWPFTDITCAGPGAHAVRLQRTFQCNALRRGYVALQTASTIYHLHIYHLHSCSYPVPRLSCIWLLKGSLLFRRHALRLPTCAPHRCCQPCSAQSTGTDPHPTPPAPYQYCAAPTHLLLPVELRRNVCPEARGVLNTALVQRHVLQVRQDRVRQGTGTLLIAGYARQPGKAKVAKGPRQSLPSREASVVSASLNKRLGTSRTEQVTSSAVPMRTHVHKNQCVRAAPGGEDTIEAGCGRKRNQGSGPVGHMGARTTARNWRQRCLRRTDHCDALQDRGRNRHMGGIHTGAPRQRVLLRCGAVWRCMGVTTTTRLAIQ